MRRRLLMLGIAGTLLLCGLLAPAGAGAEACFSSAGRPVGVGRASGPIRVTIGKSIGPISLGMTRKAITRATGPGVRLPHSRHHHFRVRRVIVDVVFGRTGRARTVSVLSDRLVINGVPIGSGIDAVAAVMPTGVQRADCGGEHGTEFVSVAGYPLGTLGATVWENPALAYIRMTDRTVP